MEYCAARCPHDPEISPLFHAYDVYKDPSGTLLVAALHVIDFQKDRFDPRAHKLFKHRTNNLSEYIASALGEERDDASVQRALENAFNRIDAEVASRAEELGFEEKRVESIKTKYNCHAVVITGGQAYLAGVGDSRVLVMGGGRFRYIEDMETASSCAIAKRLGSFVNEKDHADSATPLFRFHKEKLRNEDEYVVLVSLELLSYVPTSVGVAALLENRIIATGLVGACKAIVGPFRDATKVIIVLDLNNRSSSNWTPMAYSGRCDYTRGKLKYPLMIDLAHFSETGEWRKVEEPLAYLLPLERGCSEQVPLPQTTRMFRSYGQMSLACEREIDVKTSPGCKASTRFRFTSSDFPPLPDSRLPGASSSGNIAPSHTTLPGRAGTPYMSQGYVMGDRLKVQVNIDDLARFYETELL